MKTFHAHIYFTSESRRLAEGLPLLYFGRLINRPIGPHPTPMFEMNFRAAEESAMMKLLDEHRGPLSILVHEVVRLI